MLALINADIIRAEAIDATLLTEEAARDGVVDVPQTIFYREQDGLWVDLGRATREDVLRNALQTFIATP